MDKKLTITCVVAGALAAIPAACSSSDDDWNREVTAASDTAICVDNFGNRVDDDRCDDDWGRSAGYYHPYYLRRGAPVPYYGDSVKDPRYAAYGSYTPSTSATYGRAPASTRMTRSAAVSRGGLGSTGRGFGRGGG